MKGILGVLATAAVLLSACTATPQSTVPTSDPPETTPKLGPVLEWSLIDCAYVVGVVDVPASALQARLPSGFTVRTSTPAASAGAGALANLGFEGFECRSGAILGGAMSDLDYSSFWVPVRPAPDYARDDVTTQYYYKSNVLVPDAERRELLAQNNQSVHDGSVDLSVNLLAGGRGTFEARITMLGLGQLQASGELDQPRTPEGGRVVEYSGTREGGIAVWTTNYSVASYTSGRGVVQFPAGSWPDALVGGRPAAANVWAGRWTFDNGTIELPPQAPHAAST